MSLLPLFLSGFPVQTLESHSVCWEELAEELKQKQEDEEEEKGVISFSFLLPAFDGGLDFQFWLK